MTATDSFLIRSGQKGPPATRRGAQQGNTGALCHGFNLQPRFQDGYS